ncbi:DUF3180 domain-containing protein [Cumulibacter manganitolerans]|uniref:DUF3180 domain-containing protein n=1 Tax=Cumulibacter manganitolerans TaxID=1884992 RepID=UPI0012948EA0|nr:DUF3180 domain-containing protein [Cumulibacter manganitolerans]
MNRSTLGALFVGAAVIGWVVVSNVYGDIPRLRWYMPVWAGILALAEASFGVRLRARIQHRRGDERVDPIVAARALALARASGYLGAPLAGLWAGFAAYAGSQWGTLAVAKADTVVALVGAVFAAALALAGVWLEQCCRVPRDPDDDR